LTDYLLNNRDVGRLDNMMIESAGFDPGLVLGSPKARQRDRYWSSIRMKREQLLQKIISGDIRQV
jgi:hypothetical protein